MAKRGRPPLKSTPPSTSRSVSKTPNIEGRSGIKASRLSDSSTLPNGEGKTLYCYQIACTLSIVLVLIGKYCLTGTPRRRTRKTSGMYDSDRASNGMSEEHLSLVKIIRHISKYVNIFLFLCRFRKLVRRE